MQRRGVLSRGFLILTALAFSTENLWQTARAIAAAAQPEAQSEARLIEGAKKEGKLAFWINGWTANELEQMFGKFRQKYPFVNVEYWRASEDSQLHQKMMSEARAGIQNVDIASSEINLIAELKKAGLAKSTLGRIPRLGRRSTRILKAIGLPAISTASWWFTIQV